MNSVNYCFYQHFNISKLNCTTSVVSRAIIAISAQLVKTVITSGKDLNERARVDVCGSLKYKSKTNTNN